MYWMNGFDFAFKTHTGAKTKIILYLEILYKVCFIIDTCRYKCFVRNSKANKTKFM